MSWTIAPTRAFATIALGLLLAAPAAAQSTTKADDLLNQGDYLFKTGYYLKASEHYRLALLEDPSSPWKKLAFGHSLFAIGNYSYASYALRRGVAELDPNEPFRPDVAGLFPSRRAFSQALRDLKRYVTYSPRDPAGLTVLGYVLYAVDGEERRCRDMLLYLRRLDRDDPFAEFFLRQLERRTREGGGPPPPAEPDDEPFPPADVPEPPPPVDEPVVVVPPTPEPAPPAPKTPPLREVLEPPTRQGEQPPAAEWPEPVPSPSK